MERAEWLKRMRSMAEALYDQISPQYWVTYGLSVSETHRAYLQKFLERVAPGGAVLSAGCGAGLYDGLLLDAGHLVVGIDQPAGMLARARERFPQVRYEKMGFQEMDFREEFDGLICMDAMEHVCPEDYPGVLRKFQQALKPGGVLYFTMDNEPSVELEASYERAKARGLPVEKTIHLRPADLERDFGQLAALFSHEQDEPASETGLKADYEEHKERIIRLMVAEDEQGQLMGFNWATRSRFDANQVYFYIMVKPELRMQGAGRRLYEDFEQAAKTAQVKEIQISIRDDSPESRAFAERRGFSEQRHQIAMALDLQAFDDRPYEAVIAKLREEGIQFTSMAELGNTDEAQRKLFTLNDTSASTTPGSEGEHSWDSFEDFQKRVCQSDWYHPGGQIVAMDTATGSWAAMSAITRWEGCDYAYNLFTGVDMPYRGRKLGQAVKVLALRYARQAWKVNQVRTHHNAQNSPMIAIDRKLGYTQLPGIFKMVKMLLHGDRS